jgi:hypothetical protein
VPQTRGLRFWGSRPARPLRFPKGVSRRVARQGVNVGVGASCAVFHCKVELHEADVPPRESPLEVDLLVEPDKWIVVHSSHERGSAV